MNFWHGSLNKRVRKSIRYLGKQLSFFLNTDGNKPTIYE